MSLGVYTVKKSEVEVNNVLQECYDAIVLPLSLLEFKSLELVKKSNELSLDTRFLLISATDADSSLLSIIFDEVMHPSSSTEIFKDFFEKKSHRSKDKQEVAKAMQKLIDEANCFKEMRDVHKASIVKLLSA